jgi:hypothetical protein
MYRQRVRRLVPGGARAGLRVPVGMFTCPRRRGGLIGVIVPAGRIL